SSPPSSPQRPFAPALQSESCPHEPHRHTLPSGRTSAFDPPSGHPHRAGGTAARCVLQAAPDDRWFTGTRPGAAGDASPIDGQLAALPSREATPPSPPGVASLDESPGSECTVASPGRPPASPPPPTATDPPQPTVTTKIAARPGNWQDCDMKS